MCTPRSISIIYIALFLVTSLNLDSSNFDFICCLLIRIHFVLFTFSTIWFYENQFSMSQRSALRTFSRHLVPWPLQCGVTSSANMSTCELFAYNGRSFMHNKLIKEFNSLYHFCILHLNLTLCIVFICSESDFNSLYYFRIPSLI